MIITMNKLSLLIALLTTTTQACFAWQASTYHHPGRRHAGQHSSAAVFSSSPLQQVDVDDPFDSYQPGQATIATKDIVIGVEGEPAALGDVLTVELFGSLYPSYTKFVKISKYSFELGAGQTMPGFDKGLMGIKKGGKRLLRVPPTLAFGDRGSSEGRVPPNADLEYNVTVTAIATSDIDKAIAKIGVDRIIVACVVLALFAITPFLA